MNDSIKSSKLNTIDNNLHIHYALQQPDQLVRRISETNECQLTANASYKNHMSSIASQSNDRKRKLCVINWHDDLFIDKNLI